MEIGCLCIQKKGQLDCVRVPGVEIEQVYEQGNLAGRRDCLPKLPPTGRMQFKYLSIKVRITNTHYRGLPIFQSSMMGKQLTPWSLIHWRMYTWTP